MTIALDSNETYRYQKSNIIDKEGIYYTIMVCAPIRSNLTFNPYTVFGDEELYVESET
jgi:hypothetical protein